MSKQILSVEQMQHLQELGIDTSKASMCNILVDDGKGTVEQDSYFCLDKFHLNSRPRFTLQDILDLLPVEIIKEDRKYSLDIYRSPDRYFIAYYWCDNLLFSIDDEMLIDAAYKLLCLCIENGYVKTNRFDK